MSDDLALTTVAAIMSGIEQNSSQKWYGVEPVTVEFEDDEGSYVIEIEPGFTTEYSSTRTRYPEIPMQVLVGAQHVGAYGEMIDIPLPDDARDALTYAYLKSCRKTVGFHIVRDEERGETRVAVLLRLSPQHKVMVAASISHASINTLGMSQVDAYASEHFTDVLARSTPILPYRAAALVWGLEMAAMFDRQTPIARGMFRGGEAFVASGGVMLVCPEHIESPWFNPLAADASRDMPEPDRIPSNMPLSPATRKLRI